MAPPSRQGVKTGKDVEIEVDFRGRLFAEFWVVMPPGISLRPGIVSARPIGGLKVEGRAGATKRDKAMNARELLEVNIRLAWRECHSGVHKGRFTQACK